MANLITNIFMACQTLAQNLSEQGYHIPLVDTIFSCSEIEEKMDQNNLTGSFKNDQNKQVHVSFVLSNSVRESIIDEIIEKTYEGQKNEDVLIIVTKDEMNENFQETMNKKFIYEWEKEQRLVILLTLNRIQLNILKHEIVPKHTILTEDEIATVKTRFNICSDDQFPEISRFDPVAMLIFIKPGEVCRIDRPSKTAIFALYYRRCLNV